MDYTDPMTETISGLTGNFKVRYCEERSIMRHIMDESHNHNTNLILFYGAYIRPT